MSSAITPEESQPSPQAPARRASSASTGSASTGRKGSTMKTMYEPGEARPLWVRLCWIEKAPGKYEEMEWGIIHPESFFVNCWNVCMAISILFAVIYLSLIHI